MLCISLILLLWVPNRKRNNKSLKTRVYQSVNSFEKARSIMVGVVHYIDQSSFWLSYNRPHLNSSLLIPKSDCKDLPLITTVVQSQWPVVTCTCLTLNKNNSLNLFSLPFYFYKAVWLQRYKTANQIIMAVFPLSFLFLFLSFTHTEGWMEGWIDGCDNLIKKLCNLIEHDCNKQIEINSNCICTESSTYKLAYQIYQNRI